MNSFPSIAYYTEKVLAEKLGGFCDCCGQKSLIMRPVFFKNAMEYAEFMQLYIEIAGTCKNCSLMKIEEKKLFPYTLFSLSYYLDVKSYFL